jgi:hypothetical protein
MTLAKVGDSYIETGPFKFITGLKFPDPIIVGAGGYSLLIGRGPGDQDRQASGQDAARIGQAQADVVELQQRRHADGRLVRRADVHGEGSDRQTGEGDDRFHQQLTAGPRRGADQFSE